jgi:methyl-accepting chemotaxis protein
VVDAVSEVLEVSSADIEPAPAFGAKIRADFIAGMGKIGGKFVIILDIVRRCSRSMRSRPWLLEKRKKVTAIFESLDKFRYGDKGKSALETMREARKPFVAASIKLESMIQDKQWDNAVQYFQETYRPTYGAFAGPIVAFVDYQTELAEKVGADAEVLASSTRTLIIGLAIAALLIVALLAFLITRSITGPTGKLVAATGRMAEGDFNFKLDIDSKDEVGVLTKAIQALQANVKLLIDEMNRMSREHDAGDIDIKIDEGKFTNDFQVMARGVNNMVFGHIAVKKKAMACIKEFGEGNFDAPLEQFPGKKKFINDTIEAVRSNLKLLIAEMNHMSKEHDAGDIDVKIDEGKFTNDFQVMARGVNNMVFGHIAVKKKAMACIQEFGEGNFDAPLEQFPGKKKFINDTIEDVRSNLKRLIAEMNHMSKEHDAGDIDVKIDEGKFRNDFQVMARGVNNMVFGHIAVKKKAMACIKEFGEGNMDAPLEQFPGKKAFINNTIEQVRSNIRALVADVNRLSKAAVEGKLGTRADTTKHRGDFQRIVVGVRNQRTCAASCAGSSSRGDLTQNITSGQQHRGQALRDHHPGAHRGRCPDQRLRPGVGHRAEPVPVLVRAGRQRRGDLRVDGADERLDQPEHRERQGHRRHGLQGCPGSGTEGGRR